MKPGIAHRWSPCRSSTESWSRRAPIMKNTKTLFLFALRTLRCATLTRVARCDQAFRLGLGALSLAAALSPADSNAQERATVVRLDWQPRQAKGARPSERSSSRTTSHRTRLGELSRRRGSLQGKSTLGRDSDVRRPQRPTGRQPPGHGSFVRLPRSGRGRSRRHRDPRRRIGARPTTPDHRHQAARSSEDRARFLPHRRRRVGTRTLGRLGIGIEFPIGLPLTLDTTAYLPGERLDEAGRGARFWGLHGGATLCKSLFGLAFSLNLCAGTQVGAVWASGTALTESRSAWQPIWMLALGPKVRFSLSRTVSLDFSIAAAWVPVRPHFHWEIQDRTEELAGGPFVAFARFGVIGFLL